MMITDVFIYKFDLNLPEPFVVSSGTHIKAKNILVILDTDEGFRGYGECLPWKPISGDTQTEALKFLKKAKPTLIGKDPQDIEGIHRFLSRLEAETGQNVRAAKSAVDFACYDIIGKTTKKPVYQILGFQEPRVVPSTITVGLHKPERMVEIARKYMRRFEENGLERIKLKLKGDPEIDSKRVRSVAEIFPGELTLDVNQGFRDPEMAVEFFNELYEEFGDRILLVEEPSPQGNLEKMRRIKENSRIPIFADESASNIDDVARIIDERAADGINIKLEKVGGIYWGKRIAELAAEGGIGVMVGCTLSCGISIAASAHFAAGTGNVTNADIDSDFYFNLNMLEEGVGFKYGARLPSSKPGLGVKLKSWVEALLQRDIVVARYP